MRVLLTGSTGQIGQEIINLKPQNVEIIKPCRKELDLSNFICCKEFILREQPDWIINCGAYTSVEDAEKNLELATKINSLAPKAFTRAINEINGNLLQISSDFVFDGLKNIPYCEYDKRNPCNNYGYTKALGEKHIEETIDNIENATILRTSWVISSKGENFLTKMLKLITKREEIKVVSDQIGAPTSAKYLAKACWKLIDLKKIKKIPFILHWTDEGTASWFDIAVAIGEIALELDIIKKKACIYPIHTYEYPSTAKRPKYSVLNTINTGKCLEIQANHWRENLINTLIEYKNINII